MADSTDATAAGEEPGPAARLRRATSTTTAATTLQAYRDFIAHARACTACRTTGADCTTAADLRQTWRDAKADAA